MPICAEQHPAAPPTEEPPEHRESQPVDHGGPEELERVGEPHPGQHADGRAIDAELAQPRRQRREHQHEGEPGGEAEEQHREHARMPVGRNCFRASRATTAGGPAAAAGRRCRTHSQVVVDGERRVVGEALRLVDVDRADAAPAGPGSAPGSRCASRRSSPRPARDSTTRCTGRAPNCARGTRRRSAPRRRARRARRAPREESPNSSGSRASCADRSACGRCSSRRTG